MVCGNVYALGRHVRPRGGHGHEIVFKLCRAFTRRCLVNCLTVRAGSVANRDRLRCPASPHHRRSAEAGGKAAYFEPGGKDGGISPDIENRSRSVVSRSDVIVNRSNAIARARSDNAEDCQAGEIRQQLQWRLRNKLQNRQRPLDWLQPVDGGYCKYNFLGNVYGHTHLQKLRGLHGDQTVLGLGPTESLVVVYQPGRRREVSGRRNQPIKTSALVHTCRSLPAPVERCDDVRNVPHADMRVHQQRGDVYST